MAGHQNRGQVISTYGRKGYDPSGSSTGSAVGLSAGFAAGAVGTETCGSIVSCKVTGELPTIQINPARQQALYALKPSTGLVSNKGVLPIS